jgi:phosphoribosylanthranilate isomerase
MMKIDFNRFIQIAGIIDQTEAELFIDCGVKYLGFPLRLTVNKEDLPEENAEQIIKSLPPQCRGILITYLSDAEEISAFCNKLGTNIVQLHGRISTAELIKLRTIMPEANIIKSLVVKENNLHILEQNITVMQEHVDAFITDTYDPVTGASGATGKIHDWSVSRRLVELSPKPVILAGGLTANNVYEAIVNVRPAGVDSHTGVEGTDGRKDPNLVKQFIEESIKGFEIAGLDA